MAPPTPIAQRQLDLGAGAWFRPEPETPPANQIIVRAGFMYSGGRDIVDQFTTGDQTTAGFASVAFGFERYDLVYLNTSGVVTVLAGFPQAAASPIFAGAPGTLSGPAMPDQAVPVAYVFVDETGAVIANDGDIFDIRGLFQQTRDLDGYCVDKGSLGSAPTGASDVVSALFAAETPGGSSSVAGVITSPPSNYVHVLNHAKDEIVHDATGSRIYGRLTEAAGVWTLTYFYTDATGAETAVAAIETEAAAPTPTDIQLVGVCKVFSRNDPTRPLFASAMVQISDQIVGDIPYATETQAGKVELATSAESAAGLVIQASDTRVLTQDERNAALTANVTGVPSAGNPFIVADDPLFAGVFVPQYYFGTHNGKSGSVMLFAGATVVKSAGITHSGAGVFTVTDAGIYRVSVTGSGSAGFADMDLREPAASTIRAGTFFGTAGSGQDSCTIVAILDLAASGTFDVNNPSGSFDANENSHISIQRIA